MRMSIATLIMMTVLGRWPGTTAQAEEGLELTVEEKIFGISLIWQEANYNFAFFDLRPDLDWDAEYRRTLGRVITTRTNYEYVREAQCFVAMLGEAHTNVEPGKTFRARWAGRPPLDLEEIERRAIVVNVAAALADQIPCGSEILRVDGRTTADYLAEEVFPHMSASTEAYLWRQSIRGHPWRAVGLLIGEVGSSIALMIETPKGEVREVSVERLSADAEIDWLGTPRSSRPALEFRWLEGDIAYFALNTFNDPTIVEQFEARLGELPRARAVILDVRNNDGGNSAHGWNIGRHFSSAPLEVSRWKTRHHLAAYKAWGQRSSDPVKQAHFAMNAWDGPETFSTIDPPPGGTCEVPLAILIGPSTYSAAEDFLSFMRAVPHAVYVGQPSAGSTGQPLTFQIPGGAWVGITAKRDVMPDGTEFVGYGIPPDVEVSQTVEAYRAGRDVVLERAIETLEARR